MKRTTALWFALILNGCTGDRLKAETRPMPKCETVSAVLSNPSATRGQVAKAFIVADRSPSEEFIDELKTFTRGRLSQHEFPRHIAFVGELPKTPAGKVHRKILREREAAAATTH